MGFLDKNGLIYFKNKLLALRGAANGFASLDQNGLVPVSQIPAIGTSSSGSGGTVTNVTSDGITTYVAPGTGKLTINHYASCTGAGGTQQKNAVINGTHGEFTLGRGARINVKFTNANTADAPTLVVKHYKYNTTTKEFVAYATDPAPIYSGGSAITADNADILKGVVEMIYDESAWHVIGGGGGNTTIIQSENIELEGGDGIIIGTNGTKQNIGLLNVHPANSRLIAGPGQNTTSGPITVPSLTVDEYGRVINLEEYQCENFRILAVKIPQGEKTANVEVPGATANTSLFLLNESSILAAGLTTNFVWEFYYAGGKRKVDISVGDNLAVALTAYFLVWENSSTDIPTTGVVAPNSSSKIAQLNNTISELQSRIQTLEYGMVHKISFGGTLTLTTGRMTPLTAPVEIRTLLAGKQLLSSNVVILGQSFNGNEHVWIDNTEFEESSGTLTVILSTNETETYTVRIDILYSSTPSA